VGLQCPNVMFVWITKQYFYQFSYSLLPSHVSACTKTQETRLIRIEFSFLVQFQVAFIL